VSWHDEMLALAPKLRAQAWFLTRSASDADDLVQETLMRAWQFRHTFQPGSNLKAWMFHILRNVHLASRTSPTNRLKTVDDFEELVMTRLSHEADQEWRVQLGDLLDAVAGLPDPSREALLLVVGTGLTYEEAAQICDCSVGTIKSRISRARERLLGMFDGDLVPAWELAPAPPAARRRPRVDA